MRRIRWLEASWPFPMRTLAHKFKSNSFSLISNNGFILTRARENLIEAKYVEKSSFDEIVRDPFGNESINNRTLYKEVNFTCSIDYPQIELRDFPRGLQSFNARLSEVTDFALALSSIKLDPFKWAEAIERSFPMRFRIDLARLSEVNLEDTVSATVVLSSASDIRGAYKRFAGKRKHFVDSLQIRLYQNGALFTLQLSENGTIRTVDFLPAEIVNTIRAAIPGAILPT